MKMRILLAILTIFLLSPVVAQTAQAPAASSDPHLAKAIELRGQAVAAYAAGDYDKATELARAAKAELGLMSSASAAAAPTATTTAATAPLPASYTVRLIPDDRDCLSKIAGYPFVYGDRNEWVRLYQANKTTLKHPENADILLPGEVLVIPSISGEKREGAWSPDATYPSR